MSSHKKRNALKSQVVLGVSLENQGFPGFALWLGTSFRNAGWAFPHVTAEYGAPSVVASCHPERDTSLSESQSRNNPFSEGFLQSTASSLLLSSRSEVLYGVLVFLGSGTLRPAWERVAKEAGTSQTLPATTPSAGGSCVADSLPKASVLPVESLLKQK